jgi:hypothetical protein
MEPQIVKVAIRNGFLISTQSPMHSLIDGLLLTSPRSGGDHVPRMSGVAI